MAETKAQIAAHRDLLDEILNEALTVDWDGVEMTLTYRELRAWVREGQKFSVKLERPVYDPPYTHLKV